MSRFILAIICISLLLGTFGSTPIRYDGYRLYRVLPQRSDHLQLLAKLEVESTGLVYLDAISSPGNYVSILVAPEAVDGFLEILRNHKIIHELAEENFQHILDTERVELRKTSATSYDWTGYHTLNETYDWLESLAKNHPNQVEVLLGGRTYEGRQIRGVKVSFKSGNKGIFLEGGIHANEWISPAMATYILNEILTNSEPNIRSLVERFDWYIFPHFNPDGYVYTHTTDRLWRKTRSKGLVCDGADPNRNWGFRWMEIGASKEECSSNFGGKTEFSEVEAKSLSEYLLTLKGKIHTYISFHAHGQLLMYPYAAIKENAPNHEHLQRIGEAAVRALSKRYGTQYTLGSTYEVIYPAAGSSPDWVYSTLNVPVVFTYELRPLKSSNGFILPSSQILPSGLETFDSLLSLIAEADSLGYYS